MKLEKLILEAWNQDENNAGALLGTAKVNQDGYFIILGDNRHNSEDSRMRALCRRKMSLGWSLNEPCASSFFKKKTLLQAIESASDYSKN